MKLEREPVFGHLTLDHKPDPESFEYDELSLDSNGLKSGKVIRETLNGHLHDLKDNMKDGDQLLYLMSDGNDVKTTENLKSYKEYQSEDFVAPLTKSSLGIESMDKETGFYTDKSAVECEMPELQVCYRESSYSSVKDICIDEGVRTHDKILFESSADEKSLCTFVFRDQDTDEELKKEETEIGVYNSSGLKSSAEKEISADLTCASKSQVQCDTEDKIGNDILQDKIPENAILMKEMEEDNPHSGSSVCEENALVKDQVSSEKGNKTALTASTGSDMAAEKLDDNSKEASVTAVADSNAEEPRHSITAKELTYSSTVEKRRIIFDFSPSTAVATATGGPQNGVSEGPETENTSIVNGGPADTSTAQDGVCACDETQKTVEDKTKTQIAAEETREESVKEDFPQTGVSGSVESPNTLSVDDEASEEQNTPCQLRHVMAAEDCPQSSDSGRHRTPGPSVAEEGLPGSQFVSGHFQFGESSFSAAGPLSGRINYSGPVPYSGSISIRSDSSTTSTRSFAFPVLQNEWNSSPVRMAKADRRHFRKHRGWRQGILCCRF